MASGKGDSTVEIDIRKDLAVVLNKHSMENGSDTPDFILAQYLTNCLRSFDVAMQFREKWYGRGENHASDCSLHNEPAFPANRCDCDKCDPGRGGKR